MKTSISSLEICRNLQNSIILILICPACCTGSKAHLIVPKRLSEKPWSNKVDWSHKRSRDLRETLSRFATAFLEGTYNNQSMLLFYKILGLGIFKNSFGSFMWYFYLFYNYNGGSQKNWPKILKSSFYESEILKNVNTIKFGHHIKYSFIEAKLLSVELFCFQSSLSM